MARPFILTVREGANKGDRFRFDADGVTIGRGPANDVVLSDGGVSRTHARIERRGSRFILADNGSANGTELNGAMLRDPAELRRGDRIGVGPVVFEFSPGARPGALRVLPLGWRVALGAMASVTVALGAYAALRFRPERRGGACPDTVALGEETAVSSFGQGEVDIQCGSQVIFSFAAPPQARLVFHYTPMRIAGPSELELRLNDKHLAWAPVSGRSGEPQSVALPVALLASEGNNLLALVQTGKDKPWGVGNVRLETIAAASGDLSTARLAAERGKRKLEERRIAPRNLYDAWKGFSEARRQTEAMSPRPALYAEVSALMAACERDLDRECGKLLFAASRFDKYGETEKAQKTYREVLLHFPGDDPTGCRKKAQENIVSPQAALAMEAVIP